MIKQHYTRMNYSNTNSVSPKVKAVTLILQVDLVICASERHRRYTIHTSFQWDKVTKKATMSPLKQYKTNILTCSVRWSWMKAHLALCAPKVSNIMQTYQVTRRSRFYGVDCDWWQSRKRCNLPSHAIISRQCFVAPKGLQQLFTTY